MSQDLVALAAADDKSAGLLSFYDRLRARVVAYVDRRQTRLGATVANALLLVPDVFILLARLSLDEDVPVATRRLVGGALLYFVLPADILPEALLGVGGYLDDLVIAGAVLSHVLTSELEPIAARHWSGSHALRTVLGDLAVSSNVLLGGRVLGRVEALLRRYGVAIKLSAVSPR